MKEATDATSGAEHHGSPAGRLVFQRSNPSGGRKQALCSITLPHSRWAGTLPSLCARPLASPDLSPAFRFPNPDPGRSAAAVGEPQGEPGLLVLATGQLLRGADVGPRGAFRICAQP